MTREEAINEIKSWDFLEGKEIEAIHTLIPELKESEDERVIKTLQEYVKNRNWPLNGPTQAEVLAWLEKQKYDRMKPIYDARESFESALEKAWNDYHNGYENVDKLEDDYVECAHAKGFREGYLFGIEKQKEQKPILEVFGFKVGDAVRLKDGDGRKHIIKSFEEVEGVHGPNFYHVEFEDNSARDGIYPGEEYPNGYYTQMEKFDEEQKPTATINGEPIPTENHSVDIPLAEWSEEDKNMWTHLNGYLNGFSCSEDAIKQMADWFYELPNRFNLQAKQERNEEDEKVRKWLLEYFYLHRDDLRGASVTSMEVLSFLDGHPGNGKACDVDEFSLTLRNCLYADSELTDEQADTFARAYGEDLYKVVLGEIPTGLEKEDIEEYRNETKFNPKPGEKFWVRCKTDKSPWFDKGDERPAYAAANVNGVIIYIVHMNEDGNGNCVSYQNKEKFLKTFEIIEKPE